MITASGLLYYDVEGIKVLECLGAFCIEYPRGATNVELEFDLISNFDNKMKRYLIFHPTDGVKVKWSKDEEGTSLAVFVALYGMIQTLFEFPDGTLEKNMAIKMLLAHNASL
jgi:hypothetical protein